ncbi:MAG TPA: YciI family protein [Streptosporangiaceae bacterium]
MKSSDAANQEDAMRYLFLLYGPDEPLPGPGTPEGQKMISEWSAATEAMARAGVLIDCGPLQPPAAATTVRVRDGETLLTDGPAAEIKEQFGGYTLIECASLDEALRWAATVPTAFNGSVEVRPVVQIPDREVPG